MEKSEITKPNQRRVRKGIIIFTGNFMEWLFITLFLSILGVLTLGLGFIYLAYWQFKYFVSNLEIEIED